MITFSASIIEKLSKVNILCIGDVMLDRFLYGKVDRISPEAPVPVVHISQEIEMLGGAGNVVQNIAALGAHIDFVSVIGVDTAGNKVDRLLCQLETVSSFLDRQEHQETTLKTRVIADRQQLVRVDRENSLNLNEQQQNNLLKTIEKLLSKNDVVVLSDYGKGVLNPELNAKIIQAAKKCNVPVIVDPKSTNYSDYKGATFITPNLKELQTVCKNTISSDESIYEAAHDLMAKHDLSGLLVTRSENGMSLIEKNLDIHISTQAQEVFDVSGAGDTVIAVFALGLGVGLSSVEAAQLANIAASIVVGKIGTATVTPNELSQALSNNTSRNYIDDTPHCTSWDDALNIVLKWRADGRKIGFTNGCFDILHPGHTTLLANSKAQCDKLILGLNSDDSVTKLKGPTRPINDQNSRAHVLKSLESVDLVIVFDEETPLKLIKHLKPDLLVKGSDYNIDQVVGAKEMASWGGKVHLVDLVPKQSTTNIIKRTQSSVL